VLASKLRFAVDRLEESSLLELAADAAGRGAKKVRLTLPVEDVLDRVGPPAGSGGGGGGGGAVVDMTGDEPFSLSAYRPSSSASFGGGKVSGRWLEVAAGGGGGIKCMILVPSVKSR